MSEACVPGQAWSTTPAVVRIERDADVAVILIDNPPVNAGSQAVRSGVFVAVRSIARDSSVSTAVIMGDGRTFITGSDLKEFNLPLADGTVRYGRPRRH